MKPILTADQMRCAENRLFAGGMESKKLMDRAASELVKRTLKLLPMDGTCVIACGAGGNGGDGYAAALKLAEKGLRTVVLSVYEPKNQDAVYYRNLAKDKVFALRDVSCLEDLPRPEVWVDCLFGIGLNRRPDAIAEKLIERINEDGRRGSAVISCDVPSGLNADTGEIPGACIIAKETVTFQCRKRGHYLGLGPEVCGKITVADIGIPDEAIPEGAMRFVEDNDLRAVLPQRRLTAHKNDFGHLLIIAGSRGMAGAATLTAMAALRSGAGLVTVACPESILNILQALAPCAMCIGLSETDGAIDRGALKTLVSALAGKDAVAIGPGLSRRVSPDCIRLVLESGCKTVIDADALNIIAENPDMKALLRPCHAITPHPGEAARLLNGKYDAVTAALRLRDFGCAALVKGASSVIAGEALTLSSSGCPGMAKGGSGDALTGIVGSLLAQGLDCETALWVGSQLHGRAGEIAEKQYGRNSMLPTDLINSIGKAMGC